VEGFPAQAHVAAWDAGARARLLLGPILATGPSESRKKTWACCSAGPRCWAAPRARFWALRLSWLLGRAGRACAPVGRAGRAWGRANIGHIAQFSVFPFPEAIIDAF